MKTLAPGVLEGQTLTADLEVSCDVCIVGSGPGGSMCAEVLSKAGLGVVLLEEGGYFTRARFRQREDEAYPLLYQDGGQRVTRDAAIAIFQGRAAGGGSVVNWTTCFRTPDDVVDAWRTHHGATGVSVEDLAPHWDFIEERLSVQEIPLGVSNKNNASLYAGMKALGHEAGPVKRNVRGCALTGSCGHGCPIDAKQSATLTLIPDAIKSGASVITRSRVERLVYERDHVVAVECALLDAFGQRPTGVRLTVKPSIVIVAGGAINSPALLLRSGTPDRHDLLGRRTFLHVAVASVALFDEPVRGFQGAPQSIASHAFSKRGEEMGYFLETAPVHPMLAATSSPGFGRDHATLLAKLPFIAGHIGITIDGFHKDSVGGRVTVSPSGRPVLDYPIIDRQWRAFIDAQKLLARVALAAGAHTVMTAHDPPLFIKSEADVARVDDMPWAPSRVALFSAHQMGGCAMSEDKELGVVRSSDLRHHDIDNLHVVDGSVFPTSLGVNPQISIYGLARLAATRIVAGLR